MKEKIKISVIIKTKNSQRNGTDGLFSMLEAIKEADEIIALDENSSDETADILREYKVKTIFCSNDETEKAFFEALSAAKNDWIFVLQEDEIAPKALLLKIKEYINKYNSGFVFFERKVFLKQDDTLSTKNELKCLRQKSVLRLFRKDEISNIKFHAFEMTESDEIITLDKYKYKGKGKHKDRAKIYKFKNQKHENAYILKYIDFNLEMFEKIIEKTKKSLKTDSIYKSKVIFRSLKTFCYYYFIKLAILDKYEGLIFSAIKMFEQFIYEIGVLNKTTR